MPRAAVSQLDRPVSSLAKAHPNTVRALSNLGIRTVRDLLLSFPIRHEQLTSETDTAAVGSLCSITAVVVKSGYRKAFRRGLSMVEATLATDSGHRQAIWFNQPYVAKRLVPGAVFRFTGKLSASRGGVKLVNPFIEPATLVAANDTHESVPTSPGSIYGHNQLIPVYPTTVGLSQHSIRRLLAAARPLINNFFDPLPPSLVQQQNLLPYAEAIEKIHFANTADDTEAARRRLGFDEVLILQLALGRLRSTRQSVQAPIIPFSESVTKTFVTHLPFLLTNDQRQAAWEIIKDLGREIPMQRLLNGDVGTGKTAVAAIAAFVVAQAGWQIAVMAPTEILAQQHARTLGKLFAGTDVRLAVWTSSYKEEITESAKISPGKSKKSHQDALAKSIATGKISIVVGTNALVQPNMQFARLGLAIVDEQHRFGVATRQALLERGKTGLAPHFLSMTATPIPRSLALTAYGDLDVSVLRERPKSRPPVTTILVPEDGLDRAFTALRAELDAGRQAFVVCPLVEKTEGREDANVEDTAASLATGELRGYQIQSLHGRMKAADKEAVMNKFINKKADVLVCTSLIEVGVDVPNATVMWIEGAERFGLSQLHQFRGRVGRGAYAATCFLVPRQRGDNARARLTVLVEVSDGFVLAERDLSLRGHGDLLGEMQSGLPTFRLASITDTALTATARDLARKLLDQDQDLLNVPALRLQVDHLTDGVHGE